MPAPTTRNVYGRIPDVDEHILRADHDKGPDKRYRVGDKYFPNLKLARFEAVEQYGIPMSEELKQLIDGKLQAAELGKMRSKAVTAGKKAAHARSTPKGTVSVSARPAVKSKAKRIESFIPANRVAQPAYELHLQSNNGNPVSVSCNTIQDLEHVFGILKKYNF